MPASKVRVDNDELESIAQQFDRQADCAHQMLNALHESMDVLLEGGWVGRGATPFYREMLEYVLPAWKRLETALQNAARVTRKARQIMKQAESDAAALFRISDETGGSEKASGLAMNEGSSVQSDGDDKRHKDGTPPPSTSTSTSTSTPTATATPSATATPTYTATSTATATTTPTATPTATATPPAGTPVYLGGLTEAQLAAYQQTQTGNSCAEFAIAAALNMLYGGGVKGSDVVVAADQITDIRPWMGLRMWPDGPTSPQQQANIVNGIARNGGLSLSAKTTTATIDDLKQYLAQPNTAVIVTMGWHNSDVPQLARNSNVSNGQQTTRAGGNSRYLGLNGHAMVLAVYDPSHNDANGNSAPWGFVNSWENGGTEIFWMPEDDFKQAWGYPILGGNQAVVITGTATPAGTATPTMTPTATPTTTPTVTPTTTPTATPTPTPSNTPAPPHTVPRS